MCGFICLVRTDFSDENFVSIIRVKRIRKQRNLAVTNRLKHRAEEYLLVEKRG
jgi:hypothetical protein